jgi:hypothetical protein
VYYKSSPGQNRRAAVALTFRHDEINDVLSLAVFDQAGEQVSSTAAPMTRPVSANASSVNWKNHRNGWTGLRLKSGH